MTVLSGWILWWEGIRDKNIPPLSSVDSMNFRLRR
jgi:hypothetical protein